MTGCIERREPLEADDRRAFIRACDQSSDEIQPRLQGRCQRLSLSESLGRCTDPFHVHEDIVKDERIQRQELRLMRQGADGPLKLTWRHRADMAEILDDNQVWLRACEEALVEFVQLPAGLDRCRHLMIDLGAGGVVTVDRRAHHDGFVLDRRWIIAFMADPNQVISQPQGRDHFSCARQ